MARKNHKIYGMKIKDWEILGRLMNQPEVTKDWETVEEYINNHDVKTKRRISKKGKEMIKVFYPCGMVKEYELSRIDTTTAFEAYFGKR